MLFTSKWCFITNPFLQYLTIGSCNSEERLCLGSDSMDDDFTDDYYSWSSWCDPVVNYTPTTPVLSSITAPYDVSYCLTASSACYSMTASRSGCTQSDMASASSCLCAPAVLSLEYTCSVLGNVSCVQVPAHLDQMSGWSYCTNNIEQVLTIPPSLTASLGSGTTIRLTYDPSYSDITAGPAVTGPGVVSPGSTARKTGPTSTISSTGSASPVVSSGAAQSLQPPFFAILQKCARVFNVFYQSKK